MGWAKFFISVGLLCLGCISILKSWRYILCQLYFLWNEGDGWVGGLTGFPLRTVLIAFVCLVGAAQRCAAEVPCGIRSMRETVAPWYPAIGKAADVSGVVVLVATFDRTGEVTQVRAVSGPTLLRVPAETFVKGWHADPYTGPRSCPVVVEYSACGSACGARKRCRPRERLCRQKAGRLDTQHFVVGGFTFSIGDCAIPRLPSCGGNDGCGSFLRVHCCSRPVRTVASGAR